MEPFIFKPVWKKPNVFVSTYVLPLLQTWGSPYMYNADSGPTIIETMMIVFHFVNGNKMKTKRRHMK